MPTYEYRCNACGREFEYQQRMSDDDLVNCEVCKEPKLEKLISRTAFQLKGGGWYKDLYSSAPAAKTDDAKPAAKTEAKAETKAEPKAETKSETKASSDGGSGGSSGTGGTSSGGTSGGGTSGSGSGGTTSTSARNG